MAVERWDCAPVTAGNVLVKIHSHLQVRWTKMAFVPGKFPGTIDVVLALNFNDAIWLRA